jgi:hypothetical protein
MATGPQGLPRTAKLRHACRSASARGRLSPNPMSRHLRPSSHTHDPCTPAVVISPSTLLAALPQVHPGSAGTSTAVQASSDPLATQCTSPAVHSVMETWNLSCCEGSEGDCREANETTGGLEISAATIARGGEGSRGQGGEGQAVALWGLPTASAMLWALKNLWFGDDHDMTMLAYLACPALCYRPVSSITSNLCPVCKLCSHTVRMCKHTWQAVGPVLLICWACFPDVAPIKEKHF